MNRLPTVPTSCTLLFTRPYSPTAQETPDPALATAIAAVTVTDNRSRLSWALKGNHSRAEDAAHSLSPAAEGPGIQGRLASPLWTFSGTASPPRQWTATAWT